MVIVGAVIFVVFSSYIAFPLSSKMVTLKGSEEAIDLGFLR